MENHFCQFSDIFQVQGKMNGRCLAHILNPLFLVMFIYIQDKHDSRAGAYKNDWIFFIEIPPCEETKARWGAGTFIFTKF